MKNRKTVIVVFMLVACMLIGVGYAAIESNLYMNGSINLTADGAESELDEDVYFTAVSNENHCNANVDTTNSDIVIVRITDTNSIMAFEGDQSSFTATVQNDAGVDVVITPSFPAFEGVEFSTDASEYVCLAGQTVEITFTITLTDSVPETGISLEGTVDAPFVTFTVAEKIS